MKRLDPAHYLEAPVLALDARKRTAFDAMYQAALDQVLYRMIAERRRETDLDQRSDVLSRLLLVRDEEDPADTGLTDEELRDQLVTLLLAGHETTATALAWTFGSAHGITLAFGFTLLGVAQE